VSSLDLEARLRLVEDRLAIIDLLAAYGPAVDTADGNWLASLWTGDGEYVYDDTQLVGPAVGELIDLPTHREYLSAGCGHLLTSPHISISGDAAVAVNHSIVAVRQGDAWTPVRVSANRWNLVRADGAWRVRSRKNALLNGSTLASNLLARPEH